MSAHTNHLKHLAAVAAAAHLKHAIHSNTRHFSGTRIPIPTR